MMFDAEFREVIYPVLVFIVAFASMFSVLFCDKGSAFAKPETLKKAIHENPELRGFLEAKKSPITNDELAAEILSIKNNRYFDKVLQTQKATI
jgi:hypothetical protein